MFFRATWLSPVLVLFLFHGFTWGQEKIPALAGPELKQTQESIRKQDWFPKETRDPLEKVLGALSLSDHARKNENPAEAYATLVEAIGWSDAANEWHLSRDIFREMEARFEHPPNAIREWYLNSIRKTEFGARLAELVDVFAADMLEDDLAGTPKKWEAIHRLLANRLDALHEQNIHELES